MQHADPVVLPEARERALVALVGGVARGDQAALASLYDATSASVHGLAAA